MNLIDYGFIRSFSCLGKGGNPAPVFLVKEFPSQHLMQKIAVDLNFSEIAFIKETSSSNFYIRWFSPVSEAPICIHATVAPSWFLFARGYSNEKLIFNSNFYNFLSWQKEGVVYVKCPKFRINQIDDNDLLGDVIKETSYNLVGISNNVVIVELQKEEDVREFIPDLEAIKKMNCRALLITAKGTDSDFVYRYFAPIVGINEDPVCGSANCALAPYWSERLDKTSLMGRSLSKERGVVFSEVKGDYVVISGEAIIENKDLLKGVIGDIL